MKVIKVELLEANNKNTVGYISKALKAIKENPKNHGYSTDEVERILKFEKEFNDAIKPFEEAIKSVSKIFTDLKKTILKFDISFDFFVQQFQQISQTGWFLSPDLIKRYTLDEIIELNTNKSSKNRDDLILQRHGKQSDVEKIVNHLKNTFPNRVAIMNEINRCYDLELFSSVITLCYSQADGICNEIWSFGFFDKNQKDDYKSKLYLELNNHEFGVSSHFITQLGIDETKSSDILRTRILMIQVYVIFLATDI